MIENGAESLEVPNIGVNDLVEYLKIVDHYRVSLESLERRYALIELIRHFIENPDLAGLSHDKLFDAVKAFLDARNYNILSSQSSEEALHLFVQTNDGMEELVVDDSLFSSPHYTEAHYIYEKLSDWKIDSTQDPLEMLEAAIDFAKKGSYIQRYKGLGEMNPEQLWETTMTPENRVLLRVTIEDAEVASDTFNLFMGDEVEPRRQYIETHAKDVKHLDV